LSIYTKSSTAVKPKPEEEAPEVEIAETGVSNIIPWPDLTRIEEKLKARAPKKTRLEGKYLYHRGKRIPILHFQKAGYDKLLKLLIKEMS
jgi:hypothetical protein